MGAQGNKKTKDYNNPCQKGNKNNKIKTPTWVPKTFNNPAFIPDLKELAIIRLTVGPGTITIKKLAITKYSNTKSMTV